MNFYGRQHDLDTKGCSALRDVIGDGAHAEEFSLPKVELKTHLPEFGDQQLKEVEAAGGIVQHGEIIKVCPESLRVLLATTECGMHRLV